MVAEEKNSLTLTLSTLGWLDPLAGAGGGPHASKETQRTIFGVGAVVAAHNWLDGLGGLIGVVERDGGNVVVKDVSLDDTVKEGTTNETEFTVNGSSSTADVVPGASGVVGKSWVGVLKVGDSDYILIS